ncbi:MAG: hypothetical protein SGILL_005158, partial [Bacillariaceae sp.]
AGFGVLLLLIVLTSFGYSTKAFTISERRCPVRESLDRRPSSLQPKSVSFTETSVEDNFLSETDNVNGGKTSVTSVEAILPPPYLGFLDKDDHLPFATAPVASFPNTTTTTTHLSVASMNLLAPFYHALSLNYSTTLAQECDGSDVDQKQRFLERDRLERLPMAMRMAKQSNADILLLQEIEGCKLEIDGGHDDDDVNRNGMQSLELELQSNSKEAIGQGLCPQSEALLEQDETYHIHDGSGTNTTLHVQGYDSYVWTQLMPNNKYGDPVGLCIAWRSQKHSLIAWEGFKRGMVCKFLQQQQQVRSNNDDVNDEATTTTMEAESTFAIANLHLPARPSNILGRLKTMSRTVRKLEQLMSGQQHTMLHYHNRKSAASLDGLVIVGGDFNSDQNSVAAQLLKRGSSPYGNLYDRNYKAKVTKASALAMRHPYVFHDVYESGATGDESLRDLYAPVTVSLKGRGPGCMDHLFYSTVSSKNKHQQGKPIKSFSSGLQGRASGIRMDYGKRRQRRKKAELRQKVYTQGMRRGDNDQAARFGKEAASIQLHAVLATTHGMNDHQRNEIIVGGLPNLECGFPSDHLPVGAMFVGSEKARKYTLIGDASSMPRVVPSTQSEHDISSSKMKHGISSAVLRRRRSSRASFDRRRRHNAVLNTITAWVFEKGLDSIVCDKPLHKNELLHADGILDNLKRKSRAPDLMGIARRKAQMPSQVSRPECVIIEVAVASDPDRVRKKKLSKYSDLVDVLSNSSSYSRCELFALVFHEDGTIPITTRQDLERLAVVLNAFASAEESKPAIDSFCDDLQVLQFG